MPALKGAHGAGGVVAIVAVGLAAQVAQLLQPRLQRHNVLSVAALGKRAICILGRGRGRRRRGGAIGKRVIGVQMHLHAHRRNAGLLLAVGLFKRLHGLHRGVPVNAVHLAGQIAQLLQPLLQLLHAFALAAVLERLVGNRVLLAVVRRNGGRPCGRLCALPGAERAVGEQIVLHRNGRDAGALLAVGRFKRLYSVLRGLIEHAIGLSIHVAQLNQPVLKARDVRADAAAFQLLIAGRSLLRGNRLDAGIILRAVREQIHLHQLRSHAGGRAAIGRLKQAHRLRGRLIKRAEAVPDI